MQRAHGHTDPEKNQVRGWAEGRLASTQRTVTGKPGRLGPVLALALTTWVTVSTVLPLGVFVCLFRSLHREIRASDETARLAHTTQLSPVGLSGARLSQQVLGTALVSL